MFREWCGCDPVLLSVQKEVFRGSVEQLSYVVRVVAASFRDLEGFQQPVPSPASNAARRYCCRTAVASRKRELLLDRYVAVVGLLVRRLCGAA